MKQQPVYQRIASAFVAMQNCENSGNSEWLTKHEETIEGLCSERAPSGSGFDNGTTFDFDASKQERLVFNTAYHHMDEHGGYDGWTNHQVIVTPSLLFGYDLRITGRDRNDIKDYIGQTFAEFLDHKA